MISLIQPPINRENLKGWRTQIRKRNVVKKKDLRVRERFEKKRKEIGKKNNIEKNIKNFQKKNPIGQVQQFMWKFCGRRRCWIRKPRLRRNIEEYRIAPRGGELFSKISSKISEI